MSESANSTVTTPFPPTVGLGNVEPSSLTAEQEAMYQKVAAHFSDPAYVAAGHLNLDETKAASLPLLEEEKFWLSRECILRFLRATKWVVNTTIQRLEGTLKWRREFGMYDLITPSHVEPEAVTGKTIIFGFDTNGKPGLYLLPSRQNTSESIRQVHFVVWMLERCMDLMGPGVETLALLLNYADKAKNPSLSTSRHVLSILQTHYPERLGVALIANVPWLLRSFFALITPFIDPITLTKLKFNPEIIKDGLFTADNVMKLYWGGDADFEYKHDEYWPKLVSICEERKNEWMDNWRKLGGAVGTKEWDYKQPAPVANVPAV